MHLNLNNHIFIFTDEVSLLDRQKLELILLSYTNIKWCGTGKELTGILSLKSAKAIYIQNNELVLTDSPPNSSFYRKLIKLNIKEFLQTH